MSNRDLPHLLLRRDSANDISKFLGVERVRTIFDIGANCGDTLVGFRNVFPGSTIFAFEPTLTQYSALELLFQWDSRVLLNKIALGIKSEFVRIYHQRHSGMNSLHPAINVPHPEVGTSELVSVTTLDKFAAEHQIDHIDLLKTDTEGYDLNVLKGGERMLRGGKISFIYSEVGFEIEDVRHTYFYDVEEYLNQFGHRLVGFYEPYHHPKTGRFEFCNALFSNVKVR